MTIIETPTRRSPLKDKIRWAREHPRTPSGERISQERFAGLIGTSRRHVMRIERGDNTPRQALISRIAEVTGHDEEFFSDDDEEDDSAVAGLSDFELALRREVQRLVSRALASQRNAAPVASLAKATTGADNEGA